jgi:hypothetical protein
MARLLQHAPESHKAASKVQEVWVAHALCCCCCCAGHPWPAAPAGEDLRLWLLQARQQISGTQQSGERSRQQQQRVHSVVAVQEHVQLALAAAAVADVLHSTAAVKQQSLPELEWLSHL